ncbi:uncharacterized protein Tco025E_06931, partial [Trypanosoma conorhini]
PGGVGVATAYNAAIFCHDAVARRRGSGHGYNRSHFLPQRRRQEAWEWPRPTTQPFSATTPSPGGVGVATATTQPFSATTPSPGGVGVAMATSVSQVGSKTVPFSSSAPPRAEVLEALAQAAAIEGRRSWKGVEWTNKNVGNYIQRRFYGAEPSLRAPDLEKERRRKKSLPKIRLFPLGAKRGSGEMGPTSP